jgi:hypothetical protein
MIHKEEECCSPICKLEETLSKASVEEDEECCSPIRNLEETLPKSSRFSLPKAPRLSPFLCRLEMACMITILPISIGEKHRQQKHPSEDQNGLVPKTKRKKEPIALEQRDQKQLKMHLSQKDEEK